MDLRIYKNAMSDVRFSPDSDQIADVAHFAFVPCADIREC
jgi:hypothetical protein